MASPPQRPGIDWPRLLTVDVALFVFVVTGIFGTLAVSDDFDVVRFPLAAAGVAVAVFYYGSRVLYPAWLRRWPRWAAFVATVMVLCFASGVVGLLNAATSDAVTIKRTVERGPGVAVRDEMRGGLGWTFRKRM